MPSEPPAPSEPELDEVTPFSLDDLGLEDLQPEPDGQGFFGEPSPPSEPPITDPSAPGFNPSLLSPDVKFKLELQRQGLSAEEADAVLDQLVESVGKPDATEVHGGKSITVTPGTARNQGQQTER